MSHIGSLLEKHGFSSYSSWPIGLFWLVKYSFWLKVHHMNGHCNYWLINLTSDDPFDSLSNGTSNEVEQKNDILPTIISNYLYCTYYGI
jgi:hypothetical protein